jgi:hypothetical protein
MLKVALNTITLTVTLENDVQFVLQIFHLVAYTSSQVIKV